MNAGGDMDDFKIKLGKIIRDKRKRRGITQEALAEKLNLTTGMIGQIERGETMPSVANLRLIIDYLAIDPRAIFNGTIQGDSEYAEICSIMVQMTKEQRHILLKIARIIQEDFG